jgi:Predicted AAA-ATPase
LLADEYDAYANEYMDLHDPRLWSDTEPYRVLKAFWSNVKAGKKSRYGIRKVYITGVTPLLLSDLISGANNQENISFSPWISTMCGLTRSDLLEALRVICDNEEAVQKHLRELEHHANGYHFCQEQRVEPVFNTQTALSYLQVRKLNYHLTPALIIGHVVSQATRKARS